MLQTLLGRRSFKALVIAVGVVLALPMSQAAGQAAARAPEASSAAAGQPPEVVATEQLTVPGLEADANFGASVAIHGNLAVVGAPLDDKEVAGGQTQTDAGSAYVFRLSGGTWSLEAKLIGTDTAAGDQFGKAVDIYSGTFTHVVVGAPFDDNFAGVDAGAAYVFSAQGTTWSQVRKLDIGHNRGTNDQFGSAVAIHRSDALIGVPLDDTPDPGGLSQSGSAPAFYRPTGWGLRTSLTAGAQAGNFEFFGTAVDTAFLTAVVGAPGDDGKGAAYVFVRPDDATSAWTRQQRLTSATEASFGPSFGQAVAVGGDTIVVVEPLRVPDFFGLGYVRFYSRSGALWQETNSLIRNAEGFGHSVAIDGSAALGRESVVLGSPRETICTAPTVCGSQAGWVYLYRKSPGSPLSFTTRIRASLWGQGFHFGWDVDVTSSGTGDTVLVGMPHVNEFGVGSGKAFVVTVP
jgi:hypothetical protein